MSGQSIDLDVARRLDRLRSEHGDLVRFDRVVAMVTEILDHVRGNVIRDDMELMGELEGLASYIRDIKLEIASVRPDELQQCYLPSATDELDAIVASTEAATNSILAAAEAISDIAGEVEGDASNRLMDVTTAIYEACTFQDITGQRIGKVVKALKVVEERIDRLAKTFGSEIDELRRAAVLTVQQRSADDDAHLLNGPQLAGKAKQQDEIDALFAGG
ncbi:MAG: protein phosphatase CheZ [Alphaproteobacteria bacterium]